MSSESDKALVHGYIQSESIDATAHYVTRGRTFKDLTDKEVQDAWVAAFKSWSPEDGQADLLEDLSSELSLRGLGITQGLVAQDLLDMASKAGQMGPFSDEAEEDFSKKVTAYAQVKAAGLN